MAVLERPTWVVAPSDPAAQALALALDVPLVVAGVLRRRGATTFEAARAFLHPSLDDLADPSEIPGMPDAVARLARALDAGERIAVHGDYDADGITATAILVRGLRALGADPLWYLPHRVHDGYGLGVRAVEGLAARGARVLVAVDCGITAFDAVSRARALGLDVVVVDHHTPSSELPSAVVVAPVGAADGADPCAAGLAFSLVWALRRHLGRTPAVPADLVALAALGTVTDVVPLLGDNRRLVAAGLAQLRGSPIAGLRALVDESTGEGPVEAWHLGWQLGPRLNSAGRLGDPSPALHLLLTDDPVEARDLARTLSDLNRERQTVLEAVLAEAAEQAAETPDAPALVVAGEAWHPGVVGLVASRLVELYRRPAIAVALAEGAGRGSARSIEGFNLVDALAACGEHLTGFGGHAMAAGLSIDAQAIPEFRRAFQVVAAAAVPPSAARLHVDAELTLAEVTVPLVAALDRLAPFGAGNPQPVFAVRGVRAVTRRLVGGGVHLRMGVTDGTVFMETIGFAMAGWGEVLTFTDALVDLAFVPERDRYEAGRVRLRLRALETPAVDPQALLADTGLLVDRLFHHADEYVADDRDARGDAAEFYTKVAGVTFDDRQAVLATLRDGDALVLRREPANTHDPHAVRVAAGDGRMVGYLSARLAGRVAPAMDAGGRYRATVSRVTGGGDRTLGLNIFVERADDEPARLGAAARAAWRALDQDGAAARLPIYVNGGRTLRPALAEALAEARRGGSSVLSLPPARGWAAALAGAAAQASTGDRGALVICPTWPDVAHRTEQLRDRLAAIGFRVVPVHGMMGVGERDHAAAALRAGDADVVVASLEAACDGTLVGPWSARAGVIVLDGLSAADAALLPADTAARPCFAVAEAAEAAALARARRGVVLLRDDPPRPLIRIDDRRNSAGLDAVLEEVAQAGEKTVVYTATADACVRAAVRLRDRAGSLRVGYLHAGLPARLRQVVAGAFQEGRLGMLVTTALDEEALPADLRRAVLASFPADRRALFAACGTVGLDRRPSTVTLAFGAEDGAARRREMEGRAPSRDLLVQLYRALKAWRGELPFPWPDDETWTRVRAAAPGATVPSVDAACAIFEEVGLAAREGTAGGWQVRLVPADGRRDLRASLRFREGVRERDAFEACAGWVERAPAAEIQRAVSS